jgi:hypothetical protein
VVLILVVGYVMDDLGWLIGQRRRTETERRRHGRRSPEVATTESASRPPSGFWMSDDKQLKV